MAGRSSDGAGPPGPDDEGWRRLCRAVRGGDEQAFARFYDLWFDRALRLARAVTRGDEAMGLDVVQDVMLKVVHKLPALDGGRAVTAWMAKTIGAAAIDRCRSERRRRRRETAVARMRPEAARDDVADRLETSEQLAWLRGQLAGLTARERTLLQQRFGGEPSLGDVARRLGLTVDAVQGRARRLVLRLERAARRWLHDGS